MYWNVPGLIITVSVKVLTGTVLAYPALTQTTGVTYDIALYKVDVTDAGVCTLTDERAMASPLIARQGGSATVWSTPGTTNYRLTDMYIEMGSETVTILNGNTLIGKLVTFSVPFIEEPLVFATINSQSIDEVLEIGALAQTGAFAGFFAIACHREGNAGANIVTISWLAFGPR